jgi:hypothetical protein
VKIWIPHRAEPLVVDTVSSRVNEAVTERLDSLLRTGVRPDVAVQIAVMNRAQRRRLVRRQKEAAHRTRSDLRKAS